MSRCAQERRKCWNRSWRDVKALKIGARSREPCRFAQVAV
jgi:hypothetical protein